MYFPISRVTAEIPYASQPGVRFWDTIRGVERGDALTHVYPHFFLAQNFYHLALSKDFLLMSCKKFLPPLAHHFGSLTPSHGILSLSHFYFDHLSQHFYHVSHRILIMSHYHRGFWPFLLVFRFSHITFGYSHTEFLTSRTELRLYLSLYCTYL